ncbi:hypothetical protein ACGFNV_09245 [Streptomyces sp. NPDC048751]|uniref:hypothetical protein n=1 Tax=Streptomyces sp. NPDC048751 TaxID=3365591 RepID=UPI0037244927
MVPTAVIGLPTVFSTPGDKAQVIIPVSGTVTVLLVLLQLAAAVIAAWSAWPTPAAVLVSLLVATTLVTERQRRRWLLGNHAVENQWPPTPTDPTL